MDDKERAKKERHRWSMIVTGAFMALCGLVGGWILYSGEGDLPGFMYGRWLGARPAPAPSAVRRARPGLVDWRPFSAQALAEAGQGGKLVLLDLRAFWSRGSALMDEGAYAVPATAAWVQRTFVPVRVDGDERPDLALRYLSGGWPTTALVLPSGEVLDSGTYMAPDAFATWAQTVARGYERTKERVGEASKAAADTRRAVDPRSESAPPPPAAAREAALRRLSQAWSRPPHFPRFSALTDLRVLGLDPGAGVWQGAAKLEDPVWGGFFRYAAGDGWTRPEHEKRLEDQAEALAADRDPARRRRTLAFVARFLSAPEGGYYASVAPEVRLAEGLVVEGWRYYGLTEAERREYGLPAVDKRVFTAESARMARAAWPDAHAKKTLERLWRGSVKDGRVRRRVDGGVEGLLSDGVALAGAFAAAGQKDRARSVMRALEQDLGSGGPALYDRPGKGELPEGLDRLLVPQQNAELLRLYQDFPWLDSGKRAAQLLRWLAARSEAVDPALWALLVSRAG